MNIQQVSATEFMNRDWDIRVRVEPIKDGIGRATGRYTIWLMNCAGRSNPLQAQTTKDYGSLREAVIAALNIVGA